MDLVQQYSNVVGGYEVSFSLRLIVAVILGMIMGLERSIAGKHAGMRTYAMVSLGAALLVAISVLASLQLSMFSGVNPLQIAGSIIIGIGFIGSGLAMYRGDQIELTTASGIWVVSAVGMACGFGMYFLAIVTTVLSIVIFTVFSRLERKIRVRYGVDAK